MVSGGVWLKTVLGEANRGGHELDEENVGSGR